jgi:DNA-binding transcriptional regulator YdaS (Cro superfamily)
MKTLIDTAIEKVGSLGELALLIGASSNQVTNWRQRGVPIEHCSAIEKATNGTVTRKQLRPNDWQKIWPELDSRKKKQ